MHMKKYLLSLWLLCLALSVQAQDQLTNIPYVDVTGYAFEEVTPDELYLGIMLEDKQSKDRKSVAEQERQLQQLLKRLNIPQGDLRVADLDGSLSSRWFSKQTDGSKMLQLLLHTPEQMDAVVSGLREIGVANFQLLRTNYSKMEQLKLQLKTKAVQQAKASATALSAGVEQRIGKALWIQDQDQNYPMPMPRLMMAKAEMYDAAGAPEPSVEFRKLRVESRVQVRFTLQ